MALGWERGSEGLRAPFIPALAWARSQHTAVATRSLSLGVGAAVRGWNSALCRCTGAKSHPAGATELAVQDALCPRGAAGIAPVVWGGHPSDLCTRAVVTLARRVALKQSVAGWKGFVTLDWLKSVLRTKWGPRVG